MKSNSLCRIALIIFLTVGIVIQSSAQNSSPYWSAAGNSNATTTSKLGTTNAIPLRFVTNNTDRLSITAAGNIGIGVTNPTEKLHLNSAAGANPFRIQVNGVNTLLAHANGGLSIGSASTPSANGLYVAGRVGIGTASPQALLHLPSSGKLTLTTTDNFLLGATNSNNLAFDYNKIQARANGQANTLQLNPGGGAVALGKVNGSSNPGIYVGTDGAAASGGQYRQSGYSFTVNPNLGGGLYLYQPIGQTNLLLRAENFGNSTAVSISNMTAGNYWPAISATTAGANESILGINTAGNTQSSGIRGVHEGSGYGVHGSSTAGLGVYGYSDEGYGLFVSSGNFYSAYFNNNVYISGSVYSGSDRKLKENVEDLTGAMELLTKLQPKTYNYRHDGTYSLMKLPEGTRYGLIAQDLEKVLPQLVKETKFESAWETSNNAVQGAPPKQVKNEVTNFKSVNYTELIPIMIKGMQEQEEQNNVLKEEVRELRKIVEELRSSVTTKSVAISGSLQQNIPNPARTSTTVSYTIPKGAVHAQLLLTDNSGKTIRTISLATSGTVQISTAALNSGVYHYSLVLDGQLVETRKIIVTR